MRTYDKLIATIHARQGAVVVLRARFGVIGRPSSMPSSQGKSGQP
jgi:hypothetical protein